MSSAATLPRHVQQLSVGVPVLLSSLDPTATYNRSLYKVGDPRMRAVGGVSTCDFHSSVPFCAWSAYTAPVSSPKNAALGALMTSRCASVRFSRWGRAATFARASSPMVTAVRLPAAASYVQYVQPVLASSE